MYSCLNESLLPSRSKVQRHSRAVARAGSAGVPSGRGNSGASSVLRHVGVDARTVLPRVHHMEHVAAFGAEPADRFGRAAARKNADIGAALRLPRERGGAAHGAFHAAGERQDRKQHVPVGDAEIMHHADIGRREPLHAPEASRRIDAAEHDVGRERAGGEIAEEQQFAGARVVFRVGGERAAELAAEAVEAERCQRGRVELDRRVEFLQRQQPSGVRDDVSVGDAAQQVLGVAAVPGFGRAEPAGQGTARRVLLQPFRRAHPAVAVAHPPVLDGEGVDHAVAAEPVVLRAGRHELRVGAVAIQRARERARQLADDRQRIGVRLGPDGRVIALHDVRHGTSP